MKKCPFCSEEIQDEAIKCKHCKEWLDKPPDNGSTQETTGQHKLTPEKLAELRGQLGTPDMRPMDFDVSWESWLYRIAMWGNTKIVHIDPEWKEKEEITQDRMIKKISDPVILKLFGKWNIDNPDFSKVIISRKYQGGDGKMYTEEFIVTNDLSKVKARMKK